MNTFAKFSEEAKRKEKKVEEKTKAKKTFDKIRKLKEDYNLKSLSTFNENYSVVYKKFFATSASYPFVKFLLGIFKLKLLGLH